MCLGVRLGHSACAALRLEWHLRHGKDHEKLGIFRRDPDLKDFLCSKPAVAAAHRIQLAFERLHGYADCRDIITEYCRCGGDNGVTQKYLRRSCGLKPVEDVQGAVPDFGGVVVDASQDTELREAEGTLRTASNYFARECTLRGWNSLTYSYFLQIAMPTTCRLNMKRPQLWQRLKESGHWWDLGPKGKAKENLIPQIQTKNSYSVLLSNVGSLASAEEPAILPEHADSAAGTFPEEYDFTIFESDIQNNSVRKQNADVVCEASSV